MAGHARLAEIANDPRIDAAGGVDFTVLRHFWSPDANRDPLLPHLREQQEKAASLAALIKQRLGTDVVVTPGKTGQFDVVVDDDTVVQRGGNWITRRFGAGYPDFDAVVDLLEKRLASGAAAG